jgi:hypothetical protein
MAERAQLRVTNIQLSSRPQRDYRAYGSTNSWSRNSAPSLPDIHAGRRRAVFLVFISTLEAAQIEWLCKNAKSLRTTTTLTYPSLLPKKYLTARLEQFPIIVLHLFSIENSSADAEKQLRPASHLTIPIIAQDSVIDNC